MSCRRFADRQASSSYAVNMAQKAVLTLAPPEPIDNPLRPQSAPKIHPSMFATFRSSSFNGGSRKIGSDPS
jgi:hypothetical protein